MQQLVGEKYILRFEWMVTQIHCGVSNQGFLEQYSGSSIWYEPEGVQKTEGQTWAWVLRWLFLLCLLCLHVLSMPQKEGCLGLEQPAFGHCALVLGQFLLHCFTGSTGFSVRFLRITAEWIQQFLFLLYSEYDTTLLTKICNRKISNTNVWFCWTRKCYSTKG